MSKPTQREFEDIANILRLKLWDYTIGQGVSEEEWDALHDFEQGEISGSRFVVNVLISDFAAYFRSRNENFDDGRFRRACYTLAAYRTLPATATSVPTIAHGATATSARGRKQNVKR